MARRVLPRFEPLARACPSLQKATEVASDQAPEDKDQEKYLDEKDDDPHGEIYSTKPLRESP
jgi:hypothetical protein